MQHPRAVVVSFAIVSLAYLGSFAVTVEGQGPTEAPAGFDNLTNGFLTQADFDAAKASFEEREGVDDGLGPMYNAQACAECHHMIDQRLDAFGDEGLDHVLLERQPETRERADA